MMNDIAKVILLLSVSGSLVALVLLLLKPFIQNRVSRKWYYYVWLVVIIRLVVPYGLPIHIISDIVSSKTDYAITAVDNTVVDSAFPTVIGENTGFQSPPQIVPPVPSDIGEGIETDVIQPVADSAQNNPLDYFQTLTPFLGWIWLSIASILLVKKLLSYYYFIHFVKSGSRQIDDDAVLDVCRVACLLLGLKKELAVFTCQSIHSPMLIGFFKPMIVLPEKQMENTSRLKYVFMHELTHFKRFDIFYKWSVQIVLCVHWFNPVAYFVGREVNAACELSCDEAVIKRLTFQEQRAYGDTLLHSLELLGNNRNPAVSLTLAENSKLIKERLGAIMKFRKKSKLAVFASALLTFILCTGAAFTGVQAETINTNKEVMASNETTSLAVAASDLQNLKPVPNTSIGARAYSWRWASATGIEGNTYKKQLDEKIKWAEDLYGEKKERFMLNETISEEEITNTLGIQYMYEKSSVYRDMANIGNTFKLLPYDSSFSRTGSKKYYERSVFYVEKPSMMNLSVTYDLTEGKLGFIVISPEGKAVCAGNPLSQYSNTVTLQLEKGLWSFITINESETGAIKGTQKIEGNIASAENFVVPIEISELKANEKITYGPYCLNEKQALSVDIESWKGNGNLFVADMKEGEAFNHSVVMNKAPDGFAFLADESKYYYITIGNDSKVALTNIKGKLTLNFNGTYQSPKNGDELSALSGNNANEIKIDIPQIIPDGHKSYGPYNLKKGDVISSNLTWTNDDGGLYFAIGKEFMDFKGFHSSYGRHGKYLEKDITVQEDGLYYIFVGNPSTFEPEVKGVAGTITINNTANTTEQNDAAATNKNTKISVDISSVSGNGFVEPYGKYYLSKDDSIYADITWKGSGYVMLLYTKENLKTDDIAALIDNGVLPLGGGGKFLGAGIEITSNFAYQSQKKEIVYNLTTSADEISKTMSVPSEGDYYFYVIAKSNTEITDIQGDIIVGKKANNTYKTGDKLPPMNVWIGSAGEKKTSTGIVYSAKNFTGDRINYEFLSEENSSKTIKFNSSLTGDYQIVFTTSDRTIIKIIPPFTGNKEITLTGLPKDTISMRVCSTNVSGSLTVDSDSAVTKNENIAINVKNKNTYNISESGSFQADNNEILTLKITSSIKNGSVDLFLFDPNGKEQKITIGSSNITKEIELTKGVWAYNCSGIFKDGGNIQIIGTIE